MSAMTDLVLPSGGQLISPDASSAGITAADWIAIVGDLSVTVGLAVTLFVYIRQRAESFELIRQSAIATLRGVRNGIAPWGPAHFSTDYSGQVGLNRARLDHDQIMQHGYMQNYLVPTEPLVAIIEQRDEGRFIDVATIEAVNVALWRIGQFNQLVQQQTDFNARHAAAISGSEISQQERQAIALASERISVEIHGIAIGDSRWFATLMSRLNENASAVEAIGRRRWWRVTRRRAV